MKKNTLYTFGAVALLGAGAFLFLKNKKAKDKTEGSGEGTGTGTTTGTGSGTGTGTSADTSIADKEKEEKEKAKNILESAKKIAEARSLATQISDKRTKRNSLMSINQRDYETLIGRTFVGFGSDIAFKSHKEGEIKSLELEMKNLDEQLGKLGYMEVNGSITKIN